MGRAFEFRKERKFKRWGHMAKIFTKLGKEITVAVKQGPMWSATRGSAPSSLKRGATCRRRTSSEPSREPRRKIKEISRKSSTKDMARTGSPIL